MKSAESGSTVDMELEGDNTVNEIIESAAGYWGMNAGAYVLRRGKSLLRGSSTVADMGLINDDVVELIPDPEGGSYIEDGARTEGEARSESGIYTEGGA